jgi:hypothetical protein
MRNNGTKKGVNLTDYPLKTKTQKQTMKDEAGKLFHALLGEAGALRRALAGLELGVGLADDVFGAFAADDLAISMAAFGRGK